MNLIHVKSKIKNLNTMKRKILLIVSFLVVLVLFIGCKEILVEPDPVIPPVEITKYTIKIAVDGVGGTVTPLGTKEVVKGSNFDISVSKDLGYKSYVKVNGVSTPLTSDTYNIYGVDTNYELTFSFEKTPQWYLVQKPWKSYSWQSGLASNFTKGWEVTKYLTGSDVTMTYFTKDRYKVYDSNDVLRNDTPYYLLYNSEGKIDSLLLGANSQMQGGIRAKVIKLDADSLQIRYRSKFYEAPGVPNPSKDGMIQESYVHSQ